MTNDHIEEKFLEHGNNFHFKVIRKLRELNWDTVVSPYYSDYATNKTREVDIYAQKFFDITEMGKNEGYVKVNLFGECKYTPESHEIGLWFDKPDKSKLIHYMSDKFDFKKKSARHYITGDAESDHHHSGIERVVKLFGSSTQPKTKNEDLYKAINQTLSSLVFYCPKVEIISSDKNELVKRKYSLPVIFTDSFANIFQVNTEGIEELEKDRTFVTIEVNYAYIDNQGNQKTEFFLIDLVNFNFIEDYIDQIENSAKDYAHRIT